MLQEENEAYAPLYQQGPSGSVGVLENSIDTHAPAEQDTSPLSLIPSEPKTSLPPQNRKGRGGAILLLALVLAINLRYRIVCGI
jgi:hypothetical protein